MVEMGILFLLTECADSKKERNHKELINFCMRLISEANHYGIIHSVLFCFLSTTEMISLHNKIERDMGCVSTLVIAGVKTVGDLWKREKKEKYV